MRSRRVTREIWHSVSAHELRALRHGVFALIDRFGIVTVESPEEGACMAAPSDPKRDESPPFAFAGEGDEFENRFGQEIIRRFRQSLLRGMPEENLQLYAHGTGWSHSTSDGPSESKFAARSVEGVMKIADVVGGELGALPRYVEEMAQSFAQLQQRDFAQTAQAAAAQAGNIVSAKTERELYLALLRKVEYGVGPDGKVTQPEFWGGGPGFRGKVEELLSTDAEFRAEVERLVAQKTAEALEREAIRKSRFKKSE